MTTLSRRVAGALTVTALALGAAPAASAVSDHARTPHLRFAGESQLAAGLTFDGTTVGGLSSITYDSARDRYYAVSDARPELGQGDFRFYTLRVDVSDGQLDAGDVTVEAVTPLRDSAGQPFAPGSLDPEGLALSRRGTLILTSEGFARDRQVPPRVLEFGLDGRQVGEVALPAYVAPVPSTSGVRDNLGIESAAFTRNGRFLFTGFENALVQDGPAATPTTDSPARLMRFDGRTGRLQREYVYRTDPVAEAPSDPSMFSVNGLVELLPLNSQFLLAMERSFTVGQGNTIRIYRAALPGATNVRGVADLDDAPRVRTVRKRLLLDLDSLGLTLDNMEGMTVGPRLPDGSRALLMVSDNNFTAGQYSQFLLFSARGLGGSDRR